jgi:hypothetical protein
MTPGPTTASTTALVRERRCARQLEDAREQSERDSRHRGGRARRPAAQAQRARGEAPRLLGGRRLAPCRLRRPAAPFRPRGARAGRAAPRAAIRVRGAPALRSPGWPALRSGTPLLSPIAVRAPPRSSRSGRQHHPTHSLTWCAPLRCRGKSRPRGSMARRGARRSRRRSNRTRRVRGGELDAPLQSLRPARRPPARSRRGARLIAESATARAAPRQRFLLDGRRRTDEEIRSKCEHS